jgi:hypothetical protein
MLASSVELRLGPAYITFTHAEPVATIQSHAINKTARAFTI